MYETVFEPFSLSFAQSALSALSLTPGMKVLDVAAGSGAVALTLAQRGCRVTAVDASAGMVERMSKRADDARLDVAAAVMDGADLAFPDGAFDAALSVFGVILFPDAVRGLREMRRVTRPGGRVAIVTWTEPQHYDLAAQLRAAADRVRPAGPPSVLPAQLRFRERDACIALFKDAGFVDVSIATHTAHLEAPSARWLADRLGFAPGMAALLAGLGDARNRVLDQFVADVEQAQGTGRVRFAGRAFVASANVT